MSTERLYELVAEVSSRRRFLGKLGAAALGGVGMVLGLSTNASAQSCTCCYAYACCRLCCPAGSPGCNYPNSCSWCWTCTDTPGTCQYQCCECHVVNTDCGNDCVNVVNSWYTFLGCGTSPTNGSTLTAMP